MTWMQASQDGLSFFFFLFAMLRIEPMALSMRGKCSATELGSQSFRIQFQVTFTYCVICMCNCIYADLHKISFGGGYTAGKYYIPAPQVNTNLSITKTIASHSTGTEREEWWRLFQVALHLLLIIF